MLIHVPTKLLAKQRIRLLFCIATCLLLAGYILTFLRLESLLGLSESQQFYENVADYRYGVQFLCREAIARDQLWKHAAANVLIKRNWMTGDDMGFGRDILADKKQNFKSNNDALVRQKLSPRDENVPIPRNKRANLSFLKSKNNSKNSENFLKAKDANDPNAAFNAMSSSSSNDNLFDKFQSLMEQICQEYTSMLASEDNAEIVTYQSNSNISNVVNIEIEVKNLKNQSDDKLQTFDRQIDVSTTKNVPTSDMLDEDQIGYLKKIVKIFSQRRGDAIGETDFHLKMKKKRLKPRLEIHRTLKSGDKLPNWKKFQNRISSLSLYDDDESDPGSDQKDITGSRDAKLLKNLLEDLAVRRIVSVDELSEVGTQIKYIFTLDDGNRALFKPKRAARDSEETMDIYYMYEKERHTSEIASFHLDRILGFRRVPPAAGRTIDMINELQVHLSPHARKKFYLSPIGNQCFFGKCLYLCDPAHAVCGNGRILEGSLVTFLPNKSLSDWSSFQNPWARSYSKYSKSFWEKDPNGTKICIQIRQQSPFHLWFPLLNLIDVHIFDFLTGNKDRHHIHFFEMFGNVSQYVLIDNGKGFGRYSNDIIDILAPLYQCCLIRFTTLRTLVRMHTDPEQKLSQLMKESLSHDALPEILTPAHLTALDRRVKLILEQVLRCLSKVSDASDVIIDDDVIADNQTTAPPTHEY